MPAKFILVVDDDMTTRSAIADVLREEGHGVVVAVDGAEAIALADQRPFDLVITDLAMPRVDGITLIRRLKVSHPGLPSMVITASDDGGGAHRARLAGAADFVNKPVDLEDLLARVTRLLAVDRHPQH